MGKVVSIFGGAKRELNYLKRTKFQGMDLNGLVDRWLEYLKINRNKSDNTIQSYGSDLNQFVGFIENIQILTFKMDSEVVDGWIMWLNTARKNSARTIARKVEALRSFYKYLVKIKVISYQDNPMVYVEAPQFETNVPDCLSLSELNRMLDALDTSTARGFRNYLMILLYTFGGARESELINADLPDLNIEKMSIKVLGKGSIERIVMLPPEIMLSDDKKINLKVLCEEYLAKYRDLLCKKSIESLALFLNHSGERLSRKGVYNIFVKTAASAGINKRVTPHMARHTCGMLLTELGVDSRLIRKHLGHSSAQMTDHYSKVRDIKYKQSIRAFGTLSADLSATMGVPAEEL